MLDPQMPTRYIEIRGSAEISEDPDGELNRKMYRRHTGKEFDLDAPGAERVIVRIVSIHVSTPTLCGGRVDRRPAGIRSP